MCLYRPWCLFIQQQNEIFQLKFTRIQTLKCWKYLAVKNQIWRLSPSLKYSNLKSSAAVWETFTKFVCWRMFLPEVLLVTCMNLRQNSRWQLAFIVERICAYMRTDLGLGTALLEVLSSVGLLLWTCDIVRVCFTCALNHYLAYLHVHQYVIASYRCSLSGVPSLCNGLLIL